MTANKRILRRYTDIPALLYMLSRRKITFLDPGNWEDTNDSYYLGLYKKRRALKSLLVICFTQAAESFHHWKVFASGSGGVCVQFDRDELQKAVKARPNVRTRDVTYLTIKKNRKTGIATDDLPFLKRYGFGHEQEFRVIFESKTVASSRLNVDIELSCIEQVTLSPWIDKNLFAEVKKTLQSIELCSKLRVERSSLIGNDEWKRLGEAAR